MRQLATPIFSNLGSPINFLPHGYQGWGFRLALVFLSLQLISILWRPDFVGLRVFSVRMEV